MGRDAKTRSGVERLGDLLQPTGEETFLDVSYPHPRFRIPIWVASTVAVAIVVVAVIFSGLRDPVLPATGAVSTSPAPTIGALSTSPVTPTAPPTELVVSVVGRVENPGLVTLTPGARAAEALAHARPLPGANLTDINHAARVSDGQQINVLPEGAPPAAPAAGDKAAAGQGSAGQGSAEKISLNQATAKELTALAGVGEVTSAAIVAYREDHGGFSAIEQLQDVPGIGPAKFAQISGQVTL